MDPIVLGQQKFIKNKQGLWIDEKSKKPAPVGLIKLLDTVWAADKKQQQDNVIASQPNIVEPPPLPTIHTPIVESIPPILAPKEQEPPQTTQKLPSIKKREDSEKEVLENIEKNTKKTNENVEKLERVTEKVLKGVKTAEKENPAENPKHYQQVRQNNPKNINMIQTLGMTMSGSKDEYGRVLEPSFLRRFMTNLIPASAAYFGLRDIQRSHNAENQGAQPISSPNYVPVTQPAGHAGRPKARRSRANIFGVRKNQPSNKKTVTSRLETKVAQSQIVERIGPRYAARKANNDVRELEDVNVQSFSKNALDKLAEAINRGRGGTANVTNGNTSTNGGPGGLGGALGALLGAGSLMGRLARLFGRGRVRGPARIPRPMEQSTFRNNARRMTSDAVRARRGSLTPRGPARMVNPEIAERVAPVARRATLMTRADTAFRAQARRMTSVAARANRVFGVPTAIAVRTAEEAVRQAPSAFRSQARRLTTAAARSYRVFGTPARASPVSAAGQVVDNATSAFRAQARRLTSATARAYRVFSPRAATVAERVVERTPGTIGRSGVRTGPTVAARLARQGLAEAPVGNTTRYFGIGRSGELSVRRIPRPIPFAERIRPTTAPFIPFSERLRPPISAPVMPTAAAPVRASGGILNRIASSGVGRFIGSATLTAGVAAGGLRNRIASSGVGRFMGTAGRTAGRVGERIGLGRLSRAASGAIGRAGLRTGLGAIPVIGAAASGIMSGVEDYGRNRSLGRSLFVGFGGAGGALAGEIGGGAVGALAGGVGAIPGTIIGGIAGAAGGSAGGGALYDRMSNGNLWERARNTTEFLSPQAAMLGYARELAARRQQMLRTRTPMPATQNLVQSTRQNLNVRDATIRRQAATTQTNNINAPTTTVNQNTQQFNNNPTAAPRGSLDLRTFTE